MSTFFFKSLLTMPSNVLPLHLKQTFLLMVWIFTEGEGDGIKSRLPFKILSTYSKHVQTYENWSKLVQTCLVWSKLVQTCLDWSKLVQMCLNMFLFVLFFSGSYAGGPHRWNGLLLPYVITKTKKNKEI
jgi:hypothetical protein